ncbi:MAG: hypothetical protein KA339_04690, partial [Candidatus Kapabacteria bacterium]|nr:hypothetical protein [Candidatus Kapabacteria bacterium]
MSTLSLKADMSRLLQLSALLFLLIAVPGLASNNGKVARTAFNSAGCGTCHATGSSAAVTVSVPGSTGNTRTATPGQTLNLSVLVAHVGTGRVAGVNIAVKTDINGTTDAGTLAAGGTGLQVKMSGTARELTHTAPKTMVGNQAQYDFTWTAPTTPGTYYLRAVGLSANDDGAEDNGDVWNRLPEFTLVVQATAPTPVITLTRPNGGEQFLAGSTQAINWTSSSVTNVTIEWSASSATGPWTTIAASVAASAGTHAWTVPSTTTTTGYVRIRDAATSSTTSDVSNAAFAIVNTPPPAALAITAPAGGATLWVGSSAQIRWTSTSVQNVKIDYSTTGESGPWSSITASTPASSGVFTWTVPTDTTAALFIRIQSVETPGVTSMNTTAMSIKASAPLKLALLS